MGRRGSVVSSLGSPAPIYLMACSETLAARATYMRNRKTTPRYAEMTRVRQCRESNERPRRALTSWFPMTLYRAPCARPAS